MLGVVRIDKAIERPPMESPKTVAPTLLGGSASEQRNGSHPVNKHPNCITSRMTNFGFAAFNLL
jgi:hypothetical protein